MEIQHIAAFANGSQGGNPAGVVLCDVLPDATAMQAVAAEVGYSETVFAAPADGEWRVRYFAPEVEVDFCGHATIALGAALASAHGNGVFPLRLNHARITVEGCWTEGVLSAALQSPPTRSSAAREELVAEALALFKLPADGLDPRIPPAIVHAGADHLVLALRDRALLASMRYDLDAGRTLALRETIGTFSLIHAESPRRFHAPQPFPDRRHLRGPRYWSRRGGSRRILARSQLATWWCDRDHPGRGYGRAIAPLGRDHARIRRERPCVG